MSDMIESGSNQLCETDGALLEVKAESNSEILVLSAGAEIWVWYP